MQGNYLSWGQRLTQRQRSSVRAHCRSPRGAFFSPAEGAQWEQRQVLAHITGSKLPIVSKEMTQQEKRVRLRLLLPDLYKHQVAAPCKHRARQHRGTWTGVRVYGHPDPLNPTSSQPTWLWAGKGSCLNGNGFPMMFLPAVATFPSARREHAASWAHADVTGYRGGTWDSRRASLAAITSQ